MLNLKIHKTDIKIFIEKSFIIIGLLFFSRAFIIFFQKPNIGNKIINQSNTTYNILLAIVFGVIFLLILRNINKFLYVALLDKWIIGIILYSILSAIWSDNQINTLIRAFILTGATAFGFYLATRYTMKQQLHLYAITLLIAMILSISVAIILPNYGISFKYMGVWRGIYGHKNALGRLMALCASIYGVFLFGIKTKTKILAGMVILVSLFVLLKSFSITSVIIFLIFIILIPIYRSYQTKQKFTLPSIISVLFFVGIILSIIIYLNNREILSAVGKSPDLSDRTTLWLSVLAKISKRPILGYGLGGFWLGFEGESADIWKSFGWKPTHAHNGYLDLWLELGILGTFTIIAHLVSKFLRAIKFTQQNHSLENLWPIVYISYLFLANSTYSLLVSQYVFFWTIYVATTLRMQIEFKKLQTSNS